MARLLLFVFLWIPLLSTANPGRIIRHTLVAEIAKDSIAATWKKAGIKQVIAPVEYAVNVYRVVYESVWPNGDAIQASGFLFVPQNVGGAVPIMAYHHGTQLKKETKFEFGGENAICMAFATDGYLVAKPDYFGLGEGERFHPYQHAETEAQSSIDLLRAARNLQQALGYAVQDSIYLTGYSQGGHASMAATKFIQDRHADEFNVVASAPMSGAYDMTGVQATDMYQAYEHSGYLPYLLYGYNEVYRLYEDITVAFKTPYDTLIPKYLDGTQGFFELNKLLPHVPVEMIKEDFVKRYEDDPSFEFRKKLEENNLYNWKPEVPLLLCYCNADEQVTYKNSLKAEEVMRKNGAENVQAKQVSPHFDHNTCAPFATIYVKFWFDSFRKGSTKGKKGPLFKRMLVSMVKGNVKRKLRRQARKKDKAVKPAPIQEAVEAADPDKPAEE